MEIMCAYWRSQSGFEVDLVVGTTLAIEVKSTDLIKEKHLKGLLALADEQLFERYIVVSQDRQRRSLGEIEVWPWELFLQSLWRGEFTFRP
jgi:predicted AAA+ superfamily ATPase